MEQLKGSSAEGESAGEGEKEAITYPLPDGPPLYPAGRVLHMVSRDRGP